MSFHNVPPNGFPDLPDMEEVEAVVKDVTALKTSVAGLSGDVSDLNTEKANKVDIATEFSNLTNYNAGDLVYYEGDLYEFQADHTAGDWKASEVIQKDLSDIVTTLKSGLTVESDNISETIAGGVIKKMGNVVMLAIYDGTPTTASASDVLFTIPSKYRPAIAVNFDNSIGAKERLDIETNGNVVAKEAITDNYLRFTVTYII